MRVLLVDDDKIQLKMVSSWLEPMGFVVTAVDGVIAGLQALTEYDDIRVCFVDWHMVPFSGPAFVAAVRAEPRFADLQMFMLTAEDDAHSVARAAQMGVSGYILKPLRHRVLIEKMSELDLVVLDPHNVEQPLLGVPTEMVARPKVKVNQTHEPTKVHEKR